MKSRLLIFTLFLVFISVSCQKDEKDFSGQKYISFSAKIKAGVDYDVKTSETCAFCEGTHNLGIWVCDGDKNPSYSFPILDEFRNCKIEYSRFEDNSEEWKFFGNGKEWTNIIPVGDGTNVDIYSYYPWNENINDITAIPFIAGGTDYLWCEPVSLTSEQTTGDGILNVELSYRHVMTCIEVAVRSNVNNSILMNELNLNDKTGSNIPTAGTFNAASGEITVLPDMMCCCLSFTNDGNGVMLTNDETTPRIQFIIPEYGNYEGNFELTFKFNGMEGPTDNIPTKFTIPSSITQNGILEAGKKYIVELQLNEAMKFSIADFKSTDWNNNDVVQTNIEL